MSMFSNGNGKLKPVWAFVFSVILGALAFLVAGNIATEAAGDHPFRRELIFRALWAILLLGIFIWLLTVGDHIEDHRIAAQGLPRVRGWLKQFVMGLVLGFVLPALAVAPIYFWGHFRYKILWNWHFLPNLIAVVLTLLVGALAEELMFRGFPFQHLEKGIGTVQAVAILSFLYALLHLINPSATVWGIANTFLIGVLLTVAYLRTRALWLPWGIHFGWNATLGLLFGLPVSGIRAFNLWIYTQVYGPKWLTGDLYGIEAAATGTAAILIGILLVATLPAAKLPQPIPQPSAEPAMESLSSIKS